MPQPSLLDQVREAIRLRHYSIRTEEAYVNAVRRFILYHGKRHPREMGTDEIRQYLSYLATDEHVAASTQNLALAALLFLYREVLQIDLPLIEGVERAKRPQRVPRCPHARRGQAGVDEATGDAPPDGFAALRRRATADGMCALENQRP